MARRRQQPGQLKLFQDTVRVDVEPPAPRAVARRTDPVQSHAAARRVSRSGVAMGLMSQIIAVLSRCPGLTYREIAAEIPTAEAAEVMRRMTDKTGKKIFAKGAARKCRINGNEMATWKLQTATEAPDA